MGNQIVGGFFQHHFGKEVVDYLIDPFVAGTSGGDPESLSVTCMLFHFIQGSRGGLVKTDWSQAPFTASYRNFNANACVWSSGASSCASNTASSTSANNAWLSQEPDSTGQERLKWVQKNYMIYNYCVDTKRFPQGLPPECRTA